MRYFYDRLIQNLNSYTEIKSETTARNRILTDNLKDMVQKKA